MSDWLELQHLKEQEAMYHAENREKARLNALAIEYIQKYCRIPHGDLHPQVLQILDILEGRLPEFRMPKTPPRPKDDQEGQG